MSNKYQHSRSSRRSKKYYGRGRSRGHGRNHRGGNRHKGEYIPNYKYIARADKNFLPKSIYAQDKYYEDFEISGTLKKNIRTKGYVHPTRIQDKAIPVILKGQDILGLASTGSGKTGAFLIPILNNIHTRRTKKCLIIVPTRELAVQIEEELKDLSRNMRIYSALIIGGKNIRTQIKQLRRDPQFVIGTPGRLKDISERNELKANGFDTIVLDEVDRMLDMGFLPDIKFLLTQLPKRKQSIFFSATLTKQAENVASTLLYKPVKIQIEKESPLKNVHQDIIEVNRDNKKEKLSELLNKDEFSKVLVFSRTKRGADKLTRKLKQSGLRVDSIHGDKPQNKRQRVLKSFKSNEIDILIATDVAARGLDIPNVTHVINYDEPQTYKDYIHRIGRTGRIGKPGNALTFVESNKRSR